MLEEIDVSINEGSLPKIQSGVYEYIGLMSEFQKYDVSKNVEFQRKFRWFYRKNQARLSPQFYKIYLEYMEKQKSFLPTFEDVLTYLYSSLPSEKIHASFSNKLLATINPSMPIWDKNVLSQLSIKRPYNRCDKKKQLHATVEAYSTLVEWYNSFLKTQKAQIVIDQFDKLIPTTQMTDVKKIDWVLWGMGEKV